MTSEPPPPRSRGRTLARAASFATIAGFLVVVYEQTQIDPSRAQLERLGVLVERQEEAIELHRQLLAALSSAEEAPEEPVEDNSVSQQCAVRDATHTLVVHSVNVRASAPTLGSKAPKSGILFRDAQFRRLDSKSAGAFGFGSPWYQIQYCDQSSQLEVGWIATKLEDGTVTSRALDR